MFGSKNHSLFSFLFLQIITKNAPFIFTAFKPKAEQQKSYFHVQMALSLIISENKTNKQKYLLTS